MAISIEEAKAFIEDAKKARDNWLTIADKSWGELKKRQKSNRLWSITPNSLRRRARYPVWYSIFKIRQPLLLSRVGVPVGKDTSQDGTDGIGATAAILLERLATNLARSFDFFDVLCCARDDFLATDFGINRAYYEREELKQKVKEYIQPQQVPSPDGQQAAPGAEQPTGDVIFVDSQGKEVQSDNICQDDDGYYIEHNEVVDVENERVYLEPLLYKDVYVDPGVRRWHQVKRIAFAEYYSEEEFKEIFGSLAFSQLPKLDQQKVGRDEASPKKQSLKVYEYWDMYDKTCLWWAENGEDFIEPKDYRQPNPEEDYGDELNGLYNLSKFFPVPKPLMGSQSTDEFWPVPEYYQLVDIFEDIHNIFSRMMALTRAIRARLLFDSNIDSLQALINEAAEGDAIGVPNLGQSLTSVGGQLANAVQYLPVKECIDGLNNLYTALEQRLNVVYKLSGTSDLLQGLITDQTDRTLGERQMLEKYALNQIAEPQRKMQEYVRDCYQLLCEMALKNFKDASLEMYIMPQTLAPEHQQGFKAALGMLRENTKRFRIELETDSTIALNEQYDKQMRLELVNAMTEGIEKAAAANGPLQAVELHALKFLVQGYRQGKMFQDEITSAIDNVIEMAKQAPPPPDPAEQQAKLAAQQLQGQIQLVTIQTQSAERIEAMRVQSQGTIEQIQAQIEQLKIVTDSEQSRAELQIKMQEVAASIQEAQMKLEHDRDSLMVELRKIADKKEVDQFGLLIEQHTAGYQDKLDEMAAQMRMHEIALKDREQQLTQARSDESHQLEQLRLLLDTKFKQQEITHAAAAASAPAPITIHMPPVQQGKKSIKVQRDELGNISQLEASEG